MTLIPLVLLTNQSNSSAKPAYEEARRESDKRQQYLSQLPLQHYVEALYYYPQHHKILVEYLEGFSQREEIINKAKEKQMFIPFLSSHFARKIKQPIYSNGNAFDENEETQFLSCLFDHEFFHAREFYYGMKISAIELNETNIQQLNSLVFESVAELRAFEFQAVQWLKKGHSEEDKLFSHMMIESMKYRKLRSLCHIYFAVFYLYNCD